MICWCSPLRLPFLVCSLDESDIIPQLVAGKGPTPSFNTIFKGFVTLSTWITNTFATWVGNKMFSSNPQPNQRKSASVSGIISVKKCAIKFSLIYFLNLLKKMKISEYQLLETSIFFRSKSDLLSWKCLFKLFSFHIRFKVTEKSLLFWFHCFTFVSNYFPLWRSFISFHT